MQPSVIFTNADGTHEYYWYENRRMQAVDASQRDRRYRTIARIGADFRWTEHQARTFAAERGYTVRYDRGTVAV